MEYSVLQFLELSIKIFRDTFKELQVLILLFLKINDNGQFQKWKLDYSILKIRQIKG